MNKPLLALFTNIEGGFFLELNLPSGCTTHSCAEMLAVLAHEMALAFVEEDGDRRVNQEQMEAMITKAFNHLMETASIRSTDALGDQP